LLVFPFRFSLLIGSFLAFAGVVLLMELMFGEMISP